MSQPNNSMCAEALNALEIIRRRGEDHYLTHQNLVEFWRSATRPLERNGLGMSLAEAEA
ncbi:hypothetical protein [Atlanticothrix silvestris]|uniref:hypothetical protein n=1 Tax=Atlanticothrix silvestris TaxID=2840444 RepID=UPI001CECED8C|nr:hypothetical protein [Atlanticothrix silvestris]